MDDEQQCETREENGQITEGGGIYAFRDQVRNAYNDEQRSVKLALRNLKHT